MLDNLRADSVLDGRTVARHLGVPEEALIRWKAEGRGPPPLDFLYGAPDGSCFLPSLLPEYFAGDVRNWFARWGGRPPELQEWRAREAEKAVTLEPLSPERKFRERFSSRDREKR